MPELLVDGGFVKDEPGFFDDTGNASSFFYYRTCDQASDVFLDAVGLGAESRRSINRSTYSASVELEVMDPVQEGMAVNFSIAVMRIGGKSMTYRVTMQDAQTGTTRAILTAVGVCMDMTGPTPMTVPDEVREKLALYQVDQG